MADAGYPGIRLVEQTELLRRVAPGGKAKGQDKLPGSGAFKPDPASQPGSEAFKPGGRNSRDNGGLSTKRQAEEPAAAYWAYLHAADPPGSRWALGTWGFKVGEADSADLPSYDDGGHGTNPENHATVWFPMPTELSSTRLRLLHDQKAEDLRSFALEHGCLYRPDDPEADAESIRTTSA